MCQECYVREHRITPLLHPLDCLQQHTQYICGSCGRCICIERDPKRHLQRWNFPFSSLDLAKLYLRTADVSTKKACGIYELQHANGRHSYKIFAEQDDLNDYLQKHKNKTCQQMAPVFSAGTYTAFSNTQIRRLSAEEIKRYMEERG